MRGAVIAAAAALAAGSAGAGPSQYQAPSSAIPVHLSQFQPQAPVAPQPRPPTPTDPIVARYSPVYESCIRKAASTLDMIDCAGRESDRWDARLNRAYQARIASFNDRQRGALKRAQKAWMAFRDADCAAYEDDDWGTVSKIDASQCILRRTVERTIELEAFPADHGPG
jgi:uncharacterized protein YecT (DUF1311 family)